MDFHNPKSSDLPCFKWGGASGLNADGKYIGSWHNDDIGGNERYYPDFNNQAHGGKKHYDYTDKNGKKWRMYEDGNVEPKNGHIPDSKTENGE